MSLPAHIELLTDTGWGRYRCRECRATAGRGCSYSPDLYLQHASTCSHATPVGPGARGELLEKARRKVGDPV